MAQGRGGEQVGGSVQPREGFGVRHFVGGDQAQVALGQVHGGALRQVAQPFAVRQGLAQQAGVAVAGRAVGQHAGPGQGAARVFAPVAQAVGDGAQRLRHAACLNDGEHGQSEAPRKVGGAGVAVVQAHHAFYQHHVGLLRGLVQALAGVGFAGHPQIDVVRGLAAGELVPEGVEKVRPAFEDAHAPPLPRVQAGQGGGDGGFALPG